MKRVFNLTLGLLILLIFSSRPAHAYLDPGTGSMIIQATIGASLAALYAIKVYWKRIVTFFKKNETAA